jgi:hypothetical protein
MANSLGSVIQRLHEERGLSRLGIHKKTNGAINVNWLSSLEKGRINHPAPAKLAPLAEMSGTSVLEIYREADFMDFPFPSEDPEEQELVGTDKRADKRQRVCSRIKSHLLRFGHRPADPSAPRWRVAVSLDIARI